MKDFIQVITTVDKKELGERIAKAVLEKRLCACVQLVGPIKSSYWWEGRIEDTTEWQLLIKTRRGLYKRLEKEIRGIHPYSVPEIIAVPILNGSRDYLKWLKEEVRE